jgi:hypothetical protein
MNDILNVINLGNDVIHNNKNIDKNANKCLNNIEHLPDELQQKIYMYYHPMLSKELQHQIKTYYKNNITKTYGAMYNVMRIMSGMGGMSYST